MKPSLHDATSLLLLPVNCGLGLKYLHKRPQDVHPVHYFVVLALPFIKSIQLLDVI